MGFVRRGPKRGNEVSEFRMADLQSGRYEGVYFRTGSGNVYFMNNRGEVSSARNRYKEEVIVHPTYGSEYIRVGESFTFVNMEVHPSGTNHIDRIVPVPKGGSDAPQVREIRGELERLAGITLDQFPLRQGKSDYKGISFRTRQDVRRGDAKTGDILAMKASDESYVAVALVEASGGTATVLCDRNRYGDPVGYPRTITVAAASISNSPMERLQGNYIPDRLNILKLLAIEPPPRRPRSRLESRE